MALWRSVGAMAPRTLCSQLPVQVELQSALGEIQEGSMAWWRSRTAEEEMESIAAISAQLGCRRSRGPVPCSRQVLGRRDQSPAPASRARRAPPSAAWAARSSPAWTAARTQAAPRRRCWRWRGRRARQSTSSAAGSSASKPKVQRTATELAMLGNTTLRSNASVRCLRFRQKPPDLRSRTPGHQQELREQLASANFSASSHVYQKGCL